MNVQNVLSSNQKVTNIASNYNNVSSLMVIVDVFQLSWVSGHGRLMSPPSSMCSMLHFNFNVSTNIRTWSSSVSGVNTGHRDECGKRGVNKECSLLGQVSLGKLFFFFRRREKCLIRINGQDWDIFDCQVLLPKNSQLTSYTSFRQFHHCLLFTVLNRIFESC